MMLANKKGMEMWVIVLIVISLILLIVMLFWIGDLGTSMGNLFKKLVNLF